MPTKRRSIHDGSSTGWAIGLALLLAGLAVVPYLRSLDAPFVYDDHRTIVTNRSIEDPTNVEALLHYERFRPLTNISYAVDYQLSRRDPRGYHRTSLALHVACVLLLFSLVRSLVADRERRLERGSGNLEPDLVAWVSAGLFAVHPMAVESVVYTSARSEVLSATLALIAFLFARAAILRGGWRWVAALAVWALAIAARETAAMLPLLVLVWDLTLGPGDSFGRRRRLLRLHLPLVGLVVVGAIGRVAWMATVELEGLPRTPWHTALTEITILWRYVALLLWPTDLTLVHPTQTITTAANWRVVGSVVAVGLAVAAVWKSRTSWPLVGLGTAWFLLFLAPSTSIVPLAELMAEHRTYLASAGLFLIAGVAAGALARRIPSTIVWVGAFMVLVALSLLTHRRALVWNDPVELWADAALKAPLTWAPHYALGDELRIQGRCEEAVPVYRRAAELLPEHVGTRINLGVCLSTLDRKPEAAEALRVAAQLAPDDTKVRNNLGRLAVEQGRIEEGKHWYREVLASDPGNVAALVNLALVLEYADGDRRAALEHCEAALARDPSLTMARECVDRNRSALAAAATGDQ